MPTGFTAKIYDGENVSQRDFMLNCSRAFGALIEYRDEDNIDFEKIMNAEPKESYNKKRVEEIKCKIKELEEMSDSEILALQDKKNKDARDYYDRIIEEKTALKKRYEDMLDKIQKWTPPSDKHVQYKNYMIQQLESSIDADCFISDKPKFLDFSADEYRNLQIDKARTSLNYYQKIVDEEVVRNDSRREWLKQLWNSLPSEN